MNRQPGAGRRALPSVTRVLAEPPLAGSNLPRERLVTAVRAVIADARAALAADGQAPTAGVLAQQAVEAAAQSCRPSLQPAINATGVILHTGLGRARMAPEAARAAYDVAASHSTLEIDTDTGRRGSRQDHVRDLLRELTGAEDALVVNNCAGAVLLAVAALAAGRDVIISRGELVEIGGAFRMPDVIAAGGARLAEVGTTNRTRLSDYTAAISEQTALILRCHPSNFAITGFTEAAPLTSLVRLGAEHDLPVVDDLGSGALRQIPGLPEMPTLCGSVAAGASLVAASGDKLLGGPQAGLLIGRGGLVARCAAHPLARALRADKMAVAALEATLRLYRDPAEALERIPTLWALTRPADGVRADAMRFATLLRAVVAGAAARVTPAQSEVGGGSLPVLHLASWAVRLSVRGVQADALARALRAASPPLYGRVADGTVLLDMRTVAADEIATAVRCVAMAREALHHGREEVTE